MINRLNHMKETLMCCVEKQLDHLESVDAKELGEVVDMIKDIEEAIYYKTITEAMGAEGLYKSEKHQQYYTEPYYRDMDRYDGRMYYGDYRRMYSEGHSKAHEEKTHTPMTHGEKEYPMEWRDHREGRSPKSRRMYMESKETHQDKIAQMRELERYVQELTQDIVEMVEDASPEEKQYLSKRITALGNKVAQLTND